MTRHELKELEEILYGAEQQMGALEGGGEPVEAVLRKVRRELRDFHTLAAAHRLRELARAGVEMERYATRDSLSYVGLTMLTFALGTLREGIHEAIQEENPEAIRRKISEALELIGVEPLPASVLLGMGEGEGAGTGGEAKLASMMGDNIVTLPEPAREESVPPAERGEEPMEPAGRGATHLERIAAELGGRLVPPGGGSADSFRVEFPAASLQRVGVLLTLARDLKEIVEDTIYDSATRLERVLELTEHAAGVNLEHAEAAQRRIREAVEMLDTLEQHLSLLKPIGTEAHGRLDAVTQTIRELRSSFKNNHESFSAMLTSRGHREICGEIARKIIDVQNELEGRLSSLVKPFNAEAAGEVPK